MNTASQALHPQQLQQQPQQQQLRLDPDAVRLRASSIAGCRVLSEKSNQQNSSSGSNSNNRVGHHDHDHICVFLVGCSNNSNNSSSGSNQSTLSYLLDGSTNHTHHNSGKDAALLLARVTVYCDTGTIATARVCHGQVRHVFRRAVTSLDVVERCLRQPPPLPPIDWKLVGLVDDLQPPPSDDNHTAEPRVPEPRPVSHIGKNLELLTVGKAILLGERDKLAQHLAALQIEGSNHRLTQQEQEQQQQSLSTKQQPLHQLQEQGEVVPPNNSSNTSDGIDISLSTNNNTRDNPSSMNLTTGMEFQFSLAAGPMKHVDQCLNDIRQMNKWVKGVATNGIGTVFLYGNGGVAYTPNIPRALYHRLSQLKHSKDHANRPCYVSLGSRERYFVAFHDGSFTYKGSKGMDKELRKLAKAPASVAFGSSYDTFFIVLADGTPKWGGKHIPMALHEALGQQLQNGPHSLSCVTLGPEGEWFLRTGNGQVGWGGVSEELKEAIRELLDAGHVLNFLDFGENGSYFISYD